MAERFCSRASLLTSSPTLSRRNRFRFWPTHVRWFQRTQVRWPQGALQLSPNVGIDTLQEIFRLMATFRPTECPIGPLLSLARAVLRGEMSARDLGPLPDASWGIRVSSRQSGPALSTGPVRSVEVAAGPRRMEGLRGNAPGPTPGRSLPKNLHQPSSNKATAQICCRSDSRRVRQRIRGRVRPATLVRRLEDCRHRK